MTAHDPDWFDVRDAIVRGRMAERLAEADSWRSVATGDARSELAPESQPAHRPLLRRRVVEFVTELKLALETPAATRSS